MLQEPRARRRRLPLSALALAAALVVFGWGIVHLFELRFAGGDVYPAYSTLRRDPLGAAIYHDALAALPGLSVERNLRPLASLGLPSRLRFVRPAAGAGEMGYPSVRADRLLLPRGGCLQMAVLVPAQRVRAPGRGPARGGPRDRHVSAPGKRRSPRKAWRNNAPTGRHTRVHPNPKFRRRCARKTSSNAGASISAGSTERLGRPLPIPCPPSPVPSAVSAMEGAGEVTWHSALELRSRHARGARGRLARVVPARLAAGHRRPCGGRQGRRTHPGQRLVFPEQRGAAGRGESGVAGGVGRSRAAGGLRRNAPRHCRAARHDDPRAALRVARRAWGAGAAGRVVHLAQRPEPRTAARPGLRRPALRAAWPDATPPPVS